MVAVLSDLATAHTELLRRFTELHQAMVRLPAPAPKPSGLPKEEVEHMLPSTSMGGLDPRTTALAHVYGPFPRPPRPHCAHGARSCPAPWRVCATDLTRGPTDPQVRRSSRAQSQGSLTRPCCAAAEATSCPAARNALCASRTWAYASRCGCCPAAMPSTSTVSTRGSSVLPAVQPAVAPCAETLT